MKSLDIKWKLLPCILTLCLLLSACSIGGEVYEKTPHQSEPQGQIPPELELVSSYSAIKSKLYEMINSAVPSVQLAVVDYWGDIDKDLKSIIMEITTEYAIGSYAVSSIVYEQAKTMGYHQVSFSIQYKKTEDEIKSIINIKSGDDFQTELQNMFSEFQTHKVYNVTFKGGEKELNELAYKAYYSSPSTAVGLKSVKFNQFTNSGYTQIIEVDTEYLWPQEELIRMRDDTVSAAEEIVAEQIDKTTDEKIQFIYDYLYNIPIDAESMIVVAETNDTQPKTEPYSAYGALLTDRTAQSGIALSAKLFCDILEIPNNIVIGKKEGIPHIWMIIRRGDIWQHFDVTDRDGSYIISSIDLAQNYNYNADLYVKR